LDDIVHTSTGYDIIILGSGKDTLIVEKGNGHTVIKDFDATEDQLVLAADVFIEDTQIINDSLHLYTNFGGHVQFENIGDVGALMM
jgi:Ca2+-binding RTX toxin-like protein